MARDINRPMLHAQAVETFTNDIVPVVPTLHDGTIDTIAGRGTGGYDATPQDPEVSSLGRPVGLLYDAAGDFVFADFDHAVVRRISQPDW